MTTRVVIENGNDADVRDWNVEVTEIDSLGDPGTTHVIPPGDSAQFYIHDSVSLRVTEVEVSLEETDAGANEEGGTGIYGEGDGKAQTEEAGAASEEDREEDREEVDPATHDTAEDDTVEEGAGNIPTGKAVG